MLMSLFMLMLLRVSALEDKEKISVYKIFSQSTKETWYTFYTILFIR